MNRVVSSGRLPVSWAQQVSRALPSMAYITRSVAASAQTIRAEG